MFKIDDDVPRPARKGHGKGTFGKTRQTALALRVDQSFFVPVPDGKSFDQHRSNLANMCVSMKRAAPDTAFSTGAVTEEGVVGIRIWRDK